MPDGYRADLAYIHDAGFGDWARHAAEVLTHALVENDIRQGLVVDLGCGSGILARAVVDAGFAVLGIDQSADMIALARSKVPEGEFRTGSFVSADLPRAVAIAAVGEIFNYLFDEANTQHALETTIARLRDALSPGGLLLFDMAGPGRVTGGGPVRTFREGDGWAILVETHEDAERRLLTRRHTTFRRIGDLYRRDSETHLLRLVGREEVVPLLQSAGFRVQVLDRYGEMSFPPGVVSYLATKPPSVDL